MKAYASKDIRNIALVGHGTSGKTTLGEAMLFHAGATSRLGSVDDKNSNLDYLEEEIDKGFTISASVASIEHAGKKFNVIDTPGFADFSGELASALRVVEGAVVVIHSVSGLEVGTEVAWRRAEKRSLARVIYIGQMDRDNADFAGVLAAARERWGRTKVVPCTLPIGAGSSFEGVVEVIGGTAFRVKSGKIVQGECPDDMVPEVKAAREALMEAAAETDDALLEKYFESGALSADEVRRGLRSGVAVGAIFPVICGSALSGSGIATLFEALDALVPSPEAVGQFDVVAGEGTEARKTGDSNGPIALIFKTQVEQHVGELAFVRVFDGQMKSGDELINVNKGGGERVGNMAFLQGKEKIETSDVGTGDIAALVKLKGSGTGDTLAKKGQTLEVVGPNFPRSVISQAIKAWSKADEDKIGQALARLRQEDPTFIVTVDSELKQTVISGLGEVHLDMLVKRMSKRYGVEVEILRPRVPYRETIRGMSEAHYRHKKQTGGRGQFADAYVRVEPQERGAGYEFVNAIVGGVIPGKFIPAVDKGIQELLPEGVLAGYPIIDVKATLYDGGFHAVDSSEMAFKIAGSHAFKDAFMDCRPVLLEPIFEISVTVPESDMGAVMGDLTSRRGRTQGMEPDGTFTTIRAQAPQHELYRYSTHLRSLTGGRGAFSSKFSHYEEVPGDIAPKVIQDAKAAKEALEA